MSKTKLYIQLDKAGVVLGYSSSSMGGASEVIKESSNLTEKFLAMPFYHRYDPKADSFVFMEELRQEFIRLESEHLTSEQKLGQKLSDLEIQVLMMQQMMATQQPK